MKTIEYIVRKLYICICTIQADTISKFAFFVCNCSICCSILSVSGNILDGCAVYRIKIIVYDRICLRLWCFRIVTDTCKPDRIWIPGLDALKPGSMGIMEPDPLLCEPVDPAMIDLIVVPGIAFDATGGRIGYGKGCYDRFLPQLLDDVPIIGLAYDFQVLPRVPQESTDVRMDAIVTEKGILTMPHSKLHI